MSARGDRRPLGNAGRSIASPRGGGVMLTKANLSRIIQSSIIITPEQARLNKEEADNKKEVAAFQAKKRKDYMLQKAAETKARAPPSDVVVLEREETKARLTAARLETEEQLDASKHLNTLGARAAAFTIRQSQLHEKEEREEKERQYDQRMNLIMERDRLIFLQDQERVKKAKHQQRIADRIILQKQIADRDRQRLDKNNQTQKEFEELAYQMNAAEQEEMRKAQEKTAHHKQIQIELHMSNAKSEALKEAARRREEEEDTRIYEYQLEVARKEEEAEQYKIAKAKAETLRIAELQEKMEKAGDKRSELDELRAKRAAEQKERNFREKDKAVAEKKGLERQAMHVAREHQKHSKAQFKAIARKEQEVEYLRNIQRANDIRTKDEKFEARKHAERLENRKIVQEQISLKEKQRRYLQGNVRIEGAAIKEEYTSELSNLERIRTEKISQLRDQGVDETYLTEMQRADMRKLQMR